REHLLDLLGDVGKPFRVIAEYLHLDWRRRAFEVADHVLKELNELDFELGRLGRELLAEVGDNGVGVSTLAPRLQTDEDVAFGLLRRKQPELRSRAPRERRNVRGFLEDLLDALQDAIRLFERGARRRPVIDDESSFIGFR